MSCDSLNLRRFFRPVEGPKLLTALRRIVAGEPGGVLLESAAINPNWGRSSVFAARPVKVVEVGDLLGVALARLEGEMSASGTLGASGAGEAEAKAFQGGWIGYFSYEAGRECEPKAGWDDRKSGVPVAWWGLYGSALVREVRNNEWQVAGVTGGPAFPTEAEAVEYWQEVIDRANHLDEWTAEAMPKAFHRSHGTWSETRGEYLANVGRALEAIRAGDVFQVNLARRLRTPFAGSPVGLYQRLCEVNPASHAAYIGLGHDAAVVSSSPELFLRVRGREVVSRPIKGTRRRTGHSAADEQARRDLVTSEKERAELNMIVDLVRNDLSRVCEFGTVTVASAGEVEELATVFHRTAMVRGLLRGGYGPIDVVKAAFPAGSITGAPKVRAMQIISELEPFARGPYCGAIGWIGLGGDLQLNVAIRTLVVHDGMVDLFVGSGIVADSDPESEYDELGAKAAGMMAALQSGIGLCGSPGAPSRGAEDVIHA